MRRVFGPRTAIEAAFLVAVPVVSLAAGLGPYAIIAASAVGYLLVLLLEALLWREKPALAFPRLRRARTPRPARVATPAATPAPAPAREPAPAPPPAEPVTVAEPVVVPEPK